MAYGIEYYHEYYDRGGTLNRIDILKDGYGGSSSLITHSTGNPVVTSHTSNKDEWETKVIQGQSLTFSFFVFPADSDKYDTILASNYKDYQIKYYYDSDLVFQGWVKPENISREYLRSKHVISLTATDALADLKNIDFLDDSDQIISDKISMIEILKYALLPIGIELDFKIQLGTYESNLMASTDCVLEEIDIDCRRFIDEKGNPFKCYDVIEWLLKDYNVKLKQQDGYYQITNHHEGDSYEFEYDFATLTRQSRTAKTNIIDLANYKYQINAELQKIFPLLKVNATFKNKDLGGDITGMDLTDWNSVWDLNFYGHSVSGNIVTLTSKSSVSEENSINLTTDFNVTKITDNDYIKLSFDHQLSWYNGTDSTHVNIEIEITRPDESVVTFASYISCVSDWSHFDSPIADAFKVIETGDYNVKIKFVPNPAYLWDWDSISPIISFKVKTVAISKLIDVGSENTGNVVFDRLFQQTSGQGIASFNTDLLIADSFQITEIGAMQAYTGGAWVNTSEWRTYGHTEDVPLVDIYCRNILNNRYSYKNYLRVSVFDENNTIRFDNILTIKSHNYVILSIDTDYKLGIKNVELIELLTTYQSYDALGSANLDSINGEKITSSTVINTGDMVYPAAGIPKSTGTEWGSSITDNSTNWNTAYSWVNTNGANAITAYNDRMKWDGGATGLVAATGRASLGATTVGSNIFTLTNPGVISFLRMNADNTVTALNAGSFRTAIGASTVGSALFTLSNPGAIRFLRINANNSVTALSAADFKTALSLVSSDVGLGNVTNESKATMFNDPTFTGSGSWDTNTLYIDAVNHRVGIGITSPLSNAEIRGSTGAILTLSSSDTTIAAGEIAGQINFWKADTSTGGAGVIGSIRSVAVDAGGSFGMGFSVGSVTTPKTDALFIRYNGNVGIGTTTPAAPLDVVGNTIITGQLMVYAP